jgi:hypothetical protein
VIELIRQEIPCPSRSQTMLMLLEALAGMPNDKEPLMLTKPPRLRQH